MKLAENPTAKPEPHTVKIYTELQIAYNHYNREVFGSILPDVVITLAKKSPKTRGYFIAENWNNETMGTGAVSEISLNPKFFIKLHIIETLSTLVHEMVHCWEVYNGSAPRRCYHNKQWADKMQDIGLMPSSTGAKGGKRTGQNMSHYIIESDITDFNRATKKFLNSGWSFDWKDHFVITKKKPGKPKIKYECPECGARVWGKEELLVSCKPCNADFEEIS